MASGQSRSCQRERGGRPRPPRDAESCIGILREILEDLADGKHLLADHMDLAAMHGKVSTAGRAVLSTALPLRDGGVGESSFGLIDDLDCLVDELKAAEKAEEAARDKTQKEARKRWLEEDFSKGASNAHKATKLDAEAQPTVVKTAKGVLSASPFEFLRAMRDKYARLWAAAEKPLEYEWKCPVQELPRLTASQLREASGSFNDKTSSAYDGIHVRAYRLIGDEGLDALATLLAAVEVAGRWPTASKLITVTLIDKRLGGHRGVANLTSMYRVWSKSRKPWAQQWEERNHRSYFAAAAGIGPVDAVYRQALEHEAAAADGLSSAVVLDDLESFFETVDREMLMEEAQILGCPLAILRASLAAYTRPHVLTLDGRMAKELHARHGILPGCTFATTFVKVFYTRRIDALIARLPEGVDVDFYIDDVALSAVGTGEELVNKMVDARNALHKMLTEGLGCRIAEAKSAIVASSSKVARQIAARLNMEGAVARCAPNLGVDATAGAKRRIIRTGKSKRKSRFTSCRARGRKLAAIAKTLGTRAVNIFTSGIAPEANYGAEVWGVTDAEALRLRRTAAAALKPKSKCRSLTAVHLVHGLPTAREELRTIIHYAKQVWRAATDREAASHRRMGLPDIRRLWDAAHTGAEAAVTSYAEARARSGGTADGKTARRSWDAVRGPIGAAALTLARIGWRFSSAFELVDAHGDIVQLTTVSPAMLTKLLVSAAQDESERIIGNSWANTDPSFKGRRVCADLAIKAIRNGARNGLDRLQVGALRAAVCGGIYIRSRAAADGYDVTDECAACGAAGDTPHHRIYGCRSTERAVLAHIPRWVYEEGRKASPAAKFWTTACFPHPGDDWPVPGAVIEGRWLEADAGDRDAEEAATTAAAGSAAAQPSSGTRDLGHGAPDKRFSGRVYGDGSCSPNDIRGLARAAVAIVQVNDWGKLIRAFTFPLPRAFPQTSQASEFVMLAQARRMLEGAAVVYSDCLNVVTAASLTARRALAPGKLYAGINLDRWQVADGDKLISSVKWVKSHRALGDHDDEETARDIRANAEADRLAKQAVADHRPPSALQKATLDFFAKRAPHVAKAIAVALSTFPPAEEQRMTRLARPPRNQEEAEKKQVHWWRFEELRWRCGICSKWAVSEDIGDRHRNERCDGPKAESQARAWAGWGHRLSAARGAIPFAYCTKCGAWGSRRSHKLRAPCTAPTAAGVAALKNIAAGRHPWRKKLPQGGEAPRTDIKVVASYLPDRDAWAATGDPMQPSDPQQRQPQHDMEQQLGQTHPPHPWQPRGPREQGANQPADDRDSDDCPRHPREDFSMPETNMEEHPLEDFGENNAHDEDPFGHGGALDADPAHLAPPTDHEDRRDTRRAQDDATMIREAGSDVDTSDNRGPKRARRGPDAPPPPVAPKPCAKVRIEAIRDRLREKLAARLATDSDAGRRTDDAHDAHPPHQTDDQHAATDIDKGHSERGRDCSTIARDQHHTGDDLTLEPRNPTWRRARTDDPGAARRQVARDLLKEGEQMGKTDAGRKNINHNMHQHKVTAADDPAEPARETCRVDTTLDTKAGKTRDDGSDEPRRQDPTCHVESDVGRQLQGGGELPSRARLPPTHARPIAGSEPPRKRWCGGGPPRGARGQMHRPREPALSGQGLRGTEPPRSPHGGGRRRRGQLWYRRQGEQRLRQS